MAHSIINKVIRRIRRLVVVKYNELALYLFGKYWKIILINEYPKCGASWMKLMLGDLLKEDGYFINRGKNKFSAIKPKYFIQRHWLKHTQHAYKTIVVLRDPRDAYNSFYFFENYYQSSPQKRKLYGFDEDANDEVNMVNYLRSKLLNTKQSAPKFSYKAFWDKFKHRDDICFVKYENMKNNPLEEVSRILNYLGYPKNDEQIKKTIDNHTLERMRKKDKQSDERAQVVRKGVVGDWKNNFNQESRDLFKDQLNEMLVEMGYEKNKDW